MIEKTERFYKPILIFAKMYTYFVWGLENIFFGSDSKVRLFIIALLSKWHNYNYQYAYLLPCLCNGGGMVEPENAVSNFLEVDF